MLGFAAACGAPAPDPGDEPGLLDGDGEGDARPVELDEPGAADDVIAKVDVGYGSVSFHRMTLPDGSVQVVQSESAPNNLGRSPFERLAAEGHTALELFQSIAPEQTPPKLLEELHALEATKLERPDAAVIPGHFDPRVTVQKSAEACDAFVYEDLPDTARCEYYWGNGRIATITSGSKGLHVGQFWDYSTPNHVTLGICNESDTPIRGRVGFDLGGDSSSKYTYWGWATVGVGSMRRWYNMWQVEACGCEGSSGSFGCASFDCYWGTRYRVDGEAPRGAKYLLRTGEKQSPCSSPIGGAL